MASCYQTMITAQDVGCDLGIRVGKLIGARLVNDAPRRYLRDQTTQSREHTGTRELR